MRLRRAADAGDHAREDDRDARQQGISPTRSRQQFREQISFFTVREVANHLGVSTRSVWRWIEDRRLVAHYFGRSVRISEHDLRKFLGAHRGEQT